MGILEELGLRFVSLLLGMAAGAVLAVLDLEAFGFGWGGAVGLLHLLVALGGLVLFAMGVLRLQVALRRYGLALLLAAVVAFAFSAMLCRRKVRASRAAGDGVCAALAAYRGSAGHYPYSLQELVPALLPMVPETSMGVLRSIAFEYRPMPESDDYTLRFPSTFFLTWARGSRGDWRCDD